MMEKEKNRPIAQRLEPPAHNRSCLGSNPNGPINLFSRQPLPGRKTRQVDIEQHQAPGYRGPFSANEDRLLAADLNFTIKKMISRIHDELGPCCPLCGRWWKFKHENYSITVFCDHEDGPIDVFIPGELE